ncbi:hypothetical protein V8C34DRAFT_285655 [Trichoderma compactum]
MTGVVFFFHLFHLFTFFHRLALLVGGLSSGGQIDWGDEGIVGKGVDTSCFTVKMLSSEACMRVDPLMVSLVVL